METGAQAFSKRVFYLASSLIVPEIEALLKVKPRTIYEMVAQGRIPYRKPPGSNILRFDLDEIIAWTRAGSSKCRPRLMVLLCGHSLWWLQPQGERMSVYKRGKKGTHWHYYFRVRGVRYRGVISEVRTKREAEQAEAKIRRDI